METPGGLNWSWIGFMATAPGIVALLLAWPFWRRGQPIFGNLVGTTVVCATAMGLMLAEHIALDRILKGCLDAGTTCFPSPSAFTRFAIYAFIAMFEVFALFYLSVLYEERRRRRDYAPEWRR